VIMMYCSLLASPRSQ